MRRKKISIIGALVLGLVMSGCGSVATRLQPNRLQEVQSQSVTFTAGTETSTTTSMSKGDVSVSITSGTLSRTDNYRVYANNSMTVSCESGNITEMVFTISQNTFTTQVGTWNSDTKTWTGSSSSVTLAASGGQVRITTFTVTVQSEGGDVPPTPTTYTVTYDKNGGTGEMTGSDSPYNSGDTVTVKDSTGLSGPNGKVFNKWNTAADGSGTSYAPGSTFKISANITLYAQWKLNLPEGGDYLEIWDLGVTTSGYSSYSISRGATTYIGNVAKSGTSIQITNGTSANGKKNRCIATSTTRGLIKSVTCEYGSGTKRNISVYVSNTPYSQDVDFNTGTLAGTLSENSTTVNVTGNYAFVALLPNGGATYLSCLGFVWEDNGGVIPDDPLPVEKTFAEVLAIGASLDNDTPSTDTYKFEGYVREKDGNNYWLTATQNETINEDKSNAFELYFGTTPSEEIQNKLLENAKVELTMAIKRHNSVIENAGTISSDNIVVKVAGTAWSVPEPEVETKTVTEFIALENTQSKAYLVTGTIKYWGKTESANKDKYGNLTLTDGTSDVYIYGCTRSEDALAWNNANSYVFTNPKNFLTNDETAALVKGQIITLKLIRADYNNTIEGSGIITNIQTLDPTGVELNLTEFTLQVGEHFALEAFVLPQGAVATVTWETSDETIATVDNEGHVEAVAEGVVTITASISEQMKAECIVTVIKSSAKMSVNKNSFSLDLSSAITNPEGFEVTTENISKSGSESFHKDSGTADTDVNSIVVKAESPLFNSNPGEIVFKASLGAGSAKDPLGHNVEVCFVDAEGNEIANTTKTVTTKLNKAASLYEVKMNYSPLACGVKLSHLKENQYNVRYYSIELSYNPLRTFANVTATEVNDGNSISLENVKLKFGATLTPELREEITTTYGEITRYGVMYFRALNPKDNYSSTPVQDIYKNNEALSDRYKTAESANIDPNENYTFSVALSISSAEQYNIRIAAAPYVLANGTYYFLGEMMYSVKDLADEYIANNGAGTNLSAAALAILAGTNN